MNKERFQELLAIIESAKGLGFRVLENGTQLIGHVPHVAPEAYLHTVFAPLSESDILHLEKVILKKSVPEAYRELLTRCNGLNLYSGSLSLDGVRRSYVRKGDETRQPFAIETPNIYEQPKDSKESYFFIGGYKRDGSLLYLDQGKAFRCASHASEPLNQWQDFWEMLVSEAKRLSKIFDDKGRKTDPKISTTP